MIAVRATIVVGNVIYGNTFKLVELPLKGDTITVWNKKRTCGLNVVVCGRHWDSKHTEVELQCSPSFRRTDEELREFLISHGWR